MLLLFWVMARPSKGLTVCWSGVCGAGGGVADAPYTVRQVAVRTAQPSRQMDFIVMAPLNSCISRAGFGRGDKAEFVFLDDYSAATLGASWLRHCCKSSACFFRAFARLASFTCP